MSKRIDLTGKRFGKLIVRGFSHTGKYGKAWWVCDCDCGIKDLIVLGESLKQGRTTSCGCYRKEYMTTHGKTNTRIFRTYTDMVRRCYKPECSNYKNYGARGIKVCEEWLSEYGFEKFYEWAIANGYSDALTIDRIDVNDNYSSENCRWVTPKAQNSNKRNTFYVEYKGEKYPLAELAEMLGLPYRVVRKRALSKTYKLPINTPIDLSKSHKKKSEEIEDAINNK